MAGEGPHLDRLLTSGLQKPLLDEFMRSPGLRSDMLEVAEEIRRRWVEKVPKDTGNLRRSAATKALRSPEYPDRRWVADFTAGGPTAPYAPEVEAEGHYLDEVLREMGYNVGGGSDRVGPVGRVEERDREPTVRIFHRTQRADIADAIVREGFRPTFREGANEGYVRENSQYGYFTEGVEGQEGYGFEVVSVEVPRSAVERDPWSGHVRVRIEALQGRQFSRYQVEETDEQ